MAMWLNDGRFDVIWPLKHHMVNIRGYSVNNHNILRALALLMDYVFDGSVVNKHWIKAMSSRV